MQDEVGQIWNTGHRWCASVLNVMRMEVRAVQTESFERWAGREAGEDVRAIRAEEQVLQSGCLIDQLAQSRCIFIPVESQIKIGFIP